MRAAMFTTRGQQEKMADQGQGSHDFSPPSPCSHGPDTEVVIRREVLDSCLNTENEIKGETVENFDSGFEKWRWEPTSPPPVNDTFDLDKDSHIDTIEDKSTANRNEQSARNDNRTGKNPGVLDSEGIFQNEPVSKTLESHVNKSPGMEFRHRYANNDRMSSQEEETKVLQSNDHISELVEPKTKSYNKAEEFPSVIKEEASEQRLQDDVKSK